MGKIKNIQKAEPESLNIKDKLLETLKSSAPEVFAEGKVNWDKVRLALGEDLDASSEKFNFTWAGKAGAVTNVLIPSKATLRPAEKESVKFDTSENLFIEGDNLEVLKLLQKSYFEKVKMIYIDPPYNTGNDFVYKDDFRQPLRNYLEQSGQVDSEGNYLSTNTQASGRFHSDWLTMMYPRLKLAWNLLCHDGVIFVSIDDNEAHHLRMMMDEIFGEENFIAETIRHALKGGTGPTNTMRRTHDYVLIYAKDKIKTTLGGVESQALPLDQEDEKGKYRKGRELNKWGAGSRREDSPSMWFSIPGPNGEDVYPIRNGGTEGRWRWGKKRLLQAVKDNDVIFEKRKDGTYIVYEKVRDENPRRKSFATVLEGKFTNAQGTEDLKDLFDGKCLIDYPKPISLIKHLIEICDLDNRDIVLDFFAGSATTAQAVIELAKEIEENYRFICVQLPEFTESKSEAYKAGYKTIADIAKERICRVFKGYGDHKAIDDGFKVFKLGRSNYYDNLFEYDFDKSTEENDKAFKDYLNKAQKELFPAKINELDIIYENVIKEGMSLNAKIKEVKIGKSTAYKVSDTERELLLCLDEKLSDSAIDVLTAKEYKEKIFICFDEALNDSDKVNLALNVTLKTI